MTGVNIGESNWCEFVKFVSASLNPRLSGFFRG